MVAYWTSTKTRKTDWDIIQVHCNHWNRKGWKKDFCMPENSLKGPHICRMIEEKTKHYSVISGSTKREIRIVCQKCQKESKIEKKYEKHLIAKFTAQITLAEGYELMPENLNVKPVKPQDYKKATEKLLECENWIQIFQITASGLEELNVQDIVELQSELKIRCSYGLAKCYLFRYFMKKKSDLWSSGKRHVDYLVSTLPDDEVVREIEQLYIHSSPEVLATMTKTEWRDHIVQGLAKWKMFVESPEEYGDRMKKLDEEIKKPGKMPKDWKPEEPDN